MTQTVGSSSGPSLHARREALQTRFGLQVAARLTESTATLGADVSERLRFAREQAVERARAARRAEAASPAVVVQAGGSAALAGGGSGWGFKLAAMLPALLLAAGLVAIEVWQDDAQLTTAAEVDAALLADDLPPSAYGDAGFVEFLKMPPRE